MPISGSQGRLDFQLSSSHKSGLVRKGRIQRYCGWRKSESPVENGGKHPMILLGFNMFQPSQIGGAGFPPPYDQDGEVNGFLMSGSMDHIQFFIVIGESRW